MRGRRLTGLLLVGIALASSADAVPVIEPADRPAPLVAAAQADDMLVLRRLLDVRPRLDADQRSADGTSALHWAVYHQNIELAQALLRSGANAGAKNDYGATPMSEAAVVGNVALMRMLLTAGADVESTNADGQTALMIVARSSNVDAARLLVSRHANVNAREHWRGQTPVMWAAAQNQPAMVHFLIEHGADVNARSRVNEWQRQVTSEPRMQARPAGGFTPLLYAARKGCLDCVKALLKAGAMKDLADPDNITPLLMSVLNFNFDIAALLIRQGAEVDRWDTWGRSPLYAAVDLNTLPVGGRADRPSPDETTGLSLIELLLNAGANPNLQLKLFPPYRSLRDDRGADGLLSVGTTPFATCCKGRGSSGHEIAARTWRESCVAHSQWHHLLDGGSRQRLDEFGYPRPLQDRSTSHRGGKFVAGCARGYQTPRTTTARRRCMVPRRGAGTVSSRPWWRATLT